MRLAVLLPFVVLCACDDPSPDMCGLVGDSAAAPEVELRILDAAGAVTAIGDGARVPLILPPQGGKVIFAGLRAKNVCTGIVELRGWMRDGFTAKDPIIGLEGRPIRLVAGDDGWAYPTEPTQVSSYANIPLCPNASSSRDIHEQPYQLTVRLLDSQGRMVEKSLTVTPFCAEPEFEADCQCTCKEGYILGTSCG